LEAIRIEGTESDTSNEVRGKIDLGEVSLRSGLVVDSDVVSDSEDALESARGQVRKTPINETKTDNQDPRACGCQC